MVSESLDANQESGDPHHPGLTFTTRTHSDTLSKDYVVMAFVLVIRAQEREWLLSIDDNTWKDL
jgi:hypothetical protein